MAPQPTWQWQYDKANKLTETIDPVDRLYQQQFSPDGWLTATIAPNLSTGGAGDATTTASYGYNLDGVRTSLTTVSAIVVAVRQSAADRSGAGSHPPQRAAGSAVWRRGMGSSHGSAAGLGVIAAAARSSDERED